MFQSLGPHNSTLASNQRCSRTVQEHLALDNAFVLIDGEPGYHRIELTTTNKHCIVQTWEGYYAGN